MTGFCGGTSAIFLYVPVAMLAAIPLPLEALFDSYPKQHLRGDYIDVTTHLEDIEWYEAALDSRNRRIEQLEQERQQQGSRKNERLWDDLHEVRSPSQAVYGTETGGWLLNPPPPPNKTEPTHYNEVPR